MKFALHLRDIIAFLSSSSLNARQNRLWPVEFIVVGDDDYSFSTVTAGFDPTFDENINAFAIVRRAPRWICVKAVERVHLGKGVEDIVQMRVKIGDAFRLCESDNCIDGSFVEVEDRDVCGAKW
jgi:hypothetical protein